MPLLFIKEEDNTTQSNLEANPLTEALAVPLAQFITQTWQPVFLMELGLEYALVLANARVLHADAVLNGLVKKLDGALLMLTNKDRAAPRYMLYFGDQRPFEVAAGILGPQLETMRAWIPLLAGSLEATLQAIGDEIKIAVAEADAAVKAKADAESALLVFRTTGERAQLVNQYNALRKSTYGELGKIKHQHPELPNDFAETFFRHEGKRVEDKMSPEQLQTRIEALKAQQAILEKKRQAKLDKQKEEADARIELEQKQAAIEAKKKDREALDAEIRQMEAAL
jgi:hypothetical protein